MAASAARIGGAPLSPTEYNQSVPSNTFTRTYVRHEPMPSNVAQKVLAESKAKDAH